ncbi:HAD family hydrolase [Rossellomorea aquimaris]|uniref:D-glycero-alpha-D-manno-heptose-1,7-bisphosphate 7-phosphatase n=1 Tax=Rossellomorea aquimaris TaxID=189382 RepID=UPI001CD7610B|nr:HAD family hydrolase [Rossellomorea aquimaris]MCA1053921.1 HAD family hydrolase [Rossellomorea aquimaris]
MNRAIFLDRDGVINEVKTKRVKFVNKPEQFYFLEGVKEAVKLLTDEGFQLFVVTNQGGVGLGYLTHEQLETIHDYMVAELEIAGGKIHEVSCCTHKPHEGCSCRKPEPGMLLDLSERYDLDLSSSYMIGDREPDIEAGRKAGCKTILIVESPSPLYDADHVFSNLLEAASYLVSKSG